ncbi:MAG: glycosyltransferase family 2 protein [Leptospiraceae bacterium]|nr:glycosyltransferase family 2 protein [Leptospiraceae bacterium]
MGPCKLLSVIVPLYNEADCIQIFFPQLASVLSRLDCAHEILLVNDGSQDETGQVIDRLCAEYQNGRSIHLAKNKGKDGAVQIGLGAARGDAAVIIDGDGQHPPELVAQMLAIREQDDVPIVSGVKSRPTGAEEHAWISWAYLNFFSWVTGIDVKHSTDYKLVDRVVIDKIMEFQGNFVFFRALIKKFNFAERELAFVVQKRVSGSTRWSFLSLLRLAVSSLWIHLRLRKQLAAQEQRPSSAWSPAGSAQRQNG